MHFCVELHTKKALPPYDPGAQKQLLKNIPVQWCSYRLVHLQKCIHCGHKKINSCNDQLDDCIVWNAHNTVFVSKRSPICAQAVYFLHSTRPSVMWLNSRSSLAACDWLMSALSAMPSTRVRRHRKIWGGFLYGVYRPGKWVWIDSNGKKRKLDIP